MFNFFSKNCLSALLALVSLGTMNSLMAWDCCDCDRTYLGVFGGGIFSNSTKVSQLGTIFLLEAEGGALAVSAQGRTKSTSSGFGGIQVGQEWSTLTSHLGCSGWTLTPAVEIEGYWYSHNKKGHLINSTSGSLEHDFLDSFPIDMGVYLANTVFVLNNPCFGCFSPYVSGGIGAAHLSINSAKSFQTSPEEAGTNHFSSRRNDSTWAFAAQVKAGLRYDFCESFHVFGEYRYLYVGSSNYIFGSTVAPGHATTSPWNVKVHNIQYNAIAVGIQYDL